MPVFIVAMALALTSLYVHAEERPLMTGLGIRLPKVTPTPIYIITTSRYDTPPAVKMYALSVLKQIDTEFKQKPTLDKEGRHFCADLAIDSLVALDKNGQLVDIKFKYDPNPDPRGLRKEVQDKLLYAAQYLSPFPPFPEAERLGARLVGIPARTILECKKRWIRVEAPP